MVGRLLPGWFPHLPEQSQYNRRLRALTARLAFVQQRLAGLLACGRLRFADGTLIGVANYAGWPPEASSPAWPPTVTAPPRASTTGACAWCS